MNKLPKTLDRLKQEAKKISKAEGIPHSGALERIARLYHFPNWAAVLKADDYHRAQRQFSAEQEVVLVTKNISIFPNRLSELNNNEKVQNFVANRTFFVANGLDFTIIEPTQTGLKKSILDATMLVRDYLEKNDFHNYKKQEQGQEHKVMSVAHFVGRSISESIDVSLYRPVTKNGDPRIWFSGLPKFANPNDKLAIVVYKNRLYLFNFSQILYEALPKETDGYKQLVKLFRASSSIADELLSLLIGIAKNPIKVDVKGDTAVGMAVEKALGISANSSKNPDYKGIELKSGRSSKNRTTLFAQVADWGLSACKSSAQILGKYGYQREGAFKLYCTVSTKTTNSQGLILKFDEKAEQLIEYHGSNVVAVWPAELLRKRLLEKHAETFWIDVESFDINGEEHFNLKSVTHTKKPLEGQLFSLIESGVITMDHLIKRVESTGKTSEKGPLFKINKRDLKLLFPEPKTYILI